MKGNYESELRTGRYLIAGVIGGLIGTKLKLPAGTLIGAILSVITCKLLMKADFQIPGGVNFTAQVLVGVMVASTFQPEMLSVMKTIAVPVLFSSMAVVAGGGFAAIIIYRLHLLDAATAYIATSPGAMTSLIPLSLESNSDALVVTCFHFFRLLLILLTAPWILKALASLTR